jgi:titin
VLVLLCFLILATWAGSGEAAGIETPSGLTAVVISATQIDLSWTDNSGSEDGFKIERTSGSSSAEYTVAQNVTSFSDTGLAPNTTYNYRVRAYAGADISGYSNTAGATTPGPPAAPSNLGAVVATSSQVDLTWTDNATNESGYSIERKTGAGEYVEISAVGANTTGFSDTGLVIDTAYSYRVRAYNAVGNSGYSNDATAIIIALPAVPTSLTATVNTSFPSFRIDLGWYDNTSNETGYKIERKTEGGSYSQITTVGVNTTSYSNTGLSGGTKYYYRVRAYNSAGDSAYSNEVNATTTTSHSTTTVIKLTIGKSTYYINDRAKTMDTAAVIKENRTLLPIRYVAEAIGATVTWDRSTSKVTVTLKDKLLELWIGQNKARVNGQYMLIDDTNSNVRPIIIPPGRTMLPLRFIAESLCSKVDWDPDQMQATVTYPAP